MHRLNGEAYCEDCRRFNRENVRRYRAETRSDQAKRKTQRQAKARARALSRLAVKFPKTYAKYLDQELKRLEEEDRRKAS